MGWEKEQNHNQAAMPDKKRQRNKLTVKDIALIGMMTAVLEVSKAALSFLPNIELVSFWIILFTVFFGWRILLVIPVFILVEGCIYGAGLWWAQYLCAWPLLAVLAFLFRKQNSVWFWSILSSAFGLLFGAVCTIPYMAAGIASGGLAAGLQAAFVWWVAGLRMDIMHAVGNFVLMLVLYPSVYRAMKRAVSASSG